MTAGWHLRLRTFVDLSNEGRRIAYGEWYDDCRER